MKNNTFSKTILTVGLALTSSLAAGSTPVPGYVAPVALDTAPDYADDTRGVFVPEHAQHRLRQQSELEHMANPYGESFQMADAGYLGPNSPVSEAFMNQDTYERELNRLSGNVPAVYPTPAVQPQTTYQQPTGYAQPETGGGIFVPSGTLNTISNQMPHTAEPSKTAMQPIATSGTGGVEIARSHIHRRALDMNNGVVRLKEDRITVRRALQRMMDQIGGGDWTVVWDMAEQNAALPDMEISVYAEEPFINVMNALLARIQTRSGQPLRVIRYDNTQRIVITDRAGGHRLAGKTSSIGSGDMEEVAITETVLKENMVSLHYDEVPLVDALENIVNQAGKGEWRLRVYAGLDQVLKPAHIEEPFAIAMERVLKLFNLKYEIFPGGKLIVVTQNNRFGYNSVQQ